MAILSVRFLWRARTRGDFPIQFSTWQVEVTSGSTGSSRTPQYSRIRSMRSLSMCPSSNYGGVFMRDSGRSLCFSLYPNFLLNHDKQKMIGFWWVLHGHWALLFQTWPFQTPFFVPLVTFERDTRRKCDPLFTLHWYQCTR